MNRRELVAVLAERTETDKRSADAALQAFIDTVTETVAKGEPVAISGFAKFARRDVPAKPRRRGRNPATGEEMWFKAKPASKSVKVTPLKAFKDAVLTGKVREEGGTSEEDRRQEGGSREEDRREEVGSGQEGRPPRRRPSPRRPSRRRPSRRRRLPRRRPRAASAVDVARPGAAG